MTTLDPNWRLTDSDRRVGEKLYRRFRALEGSKSIASANAIAWLSCCLTNLRPRFVLELGAGIGTMTELLLTHPAHVEQIVSTEQNEYCRVQLQRNLTLANDPRLRIVRTSEELRDLNFQPELVIADGGFGSEVELDMVQRGTVVLVEGNRDSFRDTISAALQHRGLNLQFTRVAAPRNPYKIRWSRRFIIPLPKPVRTNKGLVWLGRVR